jgi:UDP-N-acetyl-L-fucosamine synthase
MKKIKVVTVLGTRPEIIRLSRVINALNKFCDHILVHTGQNYDYELNQIFFDDLKIKKPDYFLNSAESSSSPMETIGNIISSFDILIDQINPEALLVLGDTNSALSVIPAKRKKIPIFHMEAGNRCFDDRVPEEINRRIIDHTSDINLPYSSIARDYLIREGINPDQVIKTGSPMYEVLDYFSSNIEKSKILEELKLKKNNYFIISAHREENIDNQKSLYNLVDSINGIANSYSLPIIISTHPRTKNQIDKLKNIIFDPLVIFSKPFGFFDYIKLQKNAKVVLSDSGTISEESSILNFSAINIRTAHERPEAMEEASVMMVGLKKKRILQAIELLNNKIIKKYDNSVVADYNTPTVSLKIVKIILSYTDYINSKVWKINDI